MKQISHAKKQRQLRHLVKRFKALSNAARHDTGQAIGVLVRKIKTLARELAPVLAPFHLKRILGPVALALGISIGTPAAAQSFAPPQENPFGLVSTYSYAFPAFADLDGDGDLDLMAAEFGDYGGGLKYFRNNGTAANPQFAAPLSNPFGIVVDTAYVFPAFADLDNDGDVDLLLGTTGYYSNSGDLMYYKNTGNVGSPQFAAPVQNPFGLSSTEGFALPTFADLDGDGDLDLLVGEYYGNMQYYKNIGTANNPQFAQPQQNPFGIAQAYNVGFPAFADLDADGDLDLLVGEYYGALQYFNNSGDASTPQFDAPVENPFGLSSVEYLAAPAFADLDNDGDLDLLVGEYYGAFQYFENTTMVGTQEQNAGVALELYPNPVADVLLVRSERPLVHIEAFDAMGKLFRRYDGALSSIPVSDWESGTYLLKFMDGEGQYVARKILKE